MLDMQPTRRQFMAAPAIVRGLGNSKPKLLLLMTDQHRGDWMGCAGAEFLSTPNLDRIAREGIRFRHAYSSTPTCTPARSALLTGMSPWGHGMLGYGRVAEKYPVEMPRLLREAGYFTTGIGKMHWAPQRNLHGFHQTILDESGRAESPDFKSDYRAWFASEAPNLNPDSTGIGWNDFTATPYLLPERLHPTRWTGDCAVRFIETYEKAEPWFLKVSFARPHSPYDAPQRFWDRYRAVPLPKPAAGRWAEKYRNRSGPRDDIWHGDLGEQAPLMARTGYSGSVTFIDEQIGRILETLEKRRWLDETLIVFLSDHGDMLGDHHLWRKSYAYESSARIPMLVRGPGAARGTVSGTPVEIRDVLPTLAGAAGISLGERVEGQSLLSVKREWIDLEHWVCYDKSNHWAALTDGRWKFIRHWFDGSEQLFDLAASPHETAESADQAALRLWRTRMDKHLEMRPEGWQKSVYGPRYPGAPPRSNA